jgi:putative membrane protein
MTMRFDGFGFGVGLVGLVWLALWLVIAVGMVVLIGLGIRWLIRNTGAGGAGGGGATRPGEDPALATLRERFARGEIDATEYEERKRTLGG